MEEKSVVIIGSSSYNTLGVIESLAEKGVKSHLILLGETNNSFVCKSKYIIKIWECKVEDDVIKCLLGNVNNKQKPVIITTNDNSAGIIDRYYDELIDYYYIPNAKKQNRINELMDKKYQAGLAREIGLVCPETWYYEGDDIFDELTFPCITKAESSLDGDKSIQQIFHEKESLMAFINKCGYINLIIQQFIEKEYEFQLIGCSLNGGDEIIIPGRTHIVRPKSIQNTFYLEFFPCEDRLQGLLEKVRSFIKSTGYSGLFSVEFLHDKSGVDYFTEMNFRNDGNSYVVTKSGVNLPFLWYKEGCGELDKSDYLELQVKAVSFCPEHVYVGSIITHEVGFKEGVKNIKNASCYGLYFKNDKKPFMYFWYKYISEIFFEKIKKIFNHGKNR